MCPWPGAAHRDASLRQGTPPPVPIVADTPSADIRVGYARCSHLTQELQTQLDALAGHGIPREKIFAARILVVVGEERPVVLQEHVVGAGHRSGTVRGYSHNC